MIQRNYIETWSGKEVWLPGCDPSQICVTDMAHALSMVPRFAGHIDQFYSVAEHSLQVSFYLPEPFKLEGLLHDGTEAYLCDIPTPFKRMLPEYKVLEDDLWATMAGKYRLPFYLSEEVKFADRVMLLTERDYLKANSKRNWSPEYENTPRWPAFKPLGLSQAETAELFIQKFYEYGGQD